MKHFGLVIIFCTIASAALAQSRESIVVGGSQTVRGYGYPGVGIELQAGYALRLGKLDPDVNYSTTPRSNFTAGFALRVPLRNPSIQLGPAIDYRYGKYKGMVNDSYNHVQADVDASTHTFFAAPEIRFVNLTRKGGHYWFCDLALGYVFCLEKGTRNSIFDPSYWEGGSSTETGKRPVEAYVHTFGAKFSLGYAMPAFAKSDVFVKISLFESIFKKADIQDIGKVEYDDPQNLSSVNFTLGFRFGL